MAQSSSFTLSRATCCSRSMTSESHFQVTPVYSVWPSTMQRQLGSQQRRRPRPGAQGLPATRPTPARPPLPRKPHRTAKPPPRMLVWSGGTTTRPAQQGSAIGPSIGEGSKMTGTKPPIGFDASSQGTTAAPGFHLSETIDWSSHAARVKNQVILLPVQSRPRKTIDSIEHGSTKRIPRNREQSG